MADEIIEPVFIETDMEVIKADTRALFEQIAGRPLNPADTENLVLNVLIYRETLVRQKVQDCSVVNLLHFSRAPIIDFLGDIVGAVRLAATRATTQMDITIVGGHGGVTVPAGTRIGSTDGLAVFALSEDINVPVGITLVTGEAICTMEGSQGNGYLPGTVDKVQDPQPYIVSIVNTLTTAGGGEQETDDLFRERIRLAPSQFTTAGSTQAYRFHAISATPVIIDVGVNSPPNTGEVYLYPLMNDGSVTPIQVLDQVEAATSGERVRPLSDLVIVEPPTAIPYSLVIDVTIYPDAIGSNVQQEITDRVNAFTLEKRQKLGLDIVESQLKKRCQYDDTQVYKIELPGFVDIPVGYNEYGMCTSVVVNIIGVNNG
jgi:phage-related baseplate assembly protein